MQNIVLQMMDFQHVHKIRGARNTNAKCMHDILKKMSPDEKIEVYPAIVTSYNKESESGVKYAESTELLTEGGKEMPGLSFSGPN